MNQTIDITFPIRIVNGNKPIDYWYGPYESWNECERLTDGNRYVGMTVGIKDDSGKIIDYIFQGGTTRDDLIEKVYFNTNDDRIREAFEKTKSEIIDTIKIPTFDENTNTIVFPNISNDVSVTLLQENDITNLSLDKFVNIKQILDTQFTEVKDNIQTTNNSLSSITDNIGKLNNRIDLSDGEIRAVKNNIESTNTNINTITSNIDKINKDITGATAQITALQSTTTGNTSRILENEEILNRTRATIDETVDNVALSTVNTLSNDINHIVLDRSLLELEEKIASMEAIPEAAVLATINDTTKYKFLRIVTYNNIENINVVDKVVIINTLNEKLINDGNEDNKYIYMFADVDKPSTINYQFSCYYINVGGNIKELQFKKRFTTTEFTQFQQQETGKTTGGTNKTPYSITVNGKECLYYINPTNTEYTDSVLKIYSTSYNWKLITKLYDKNNDKYIDLLTTDTTGDNIADVNEECYDVIDIHNNGVITFEYILKEEYVAEGDNSYIYNTIAKLTNNGNIATKTIYLICYKDGRFENSQNEEYGFYFKPYIWYNGSVKRLNTTVTMGYALNGQNWDYTTPISIPYTINNNVYNTVDDLLYTTQTQTKTTEKIIKKGTPAQPEINKVIVSDLGEEYILPKDNMHRILMETKDYIYDNGLQDEDPNDINGRLYNLSNYFSECNFYSKELNEKEQQYVMNIDTILSSSRTFIIENYLNNDKNDIIKVISYALASTIFKNKLYEYDNYFELIQEFSSNIEKDVDDILSKDNILDIFVAIFGINDSIVKPLMYGVMYTLMNYKNYTDNEKYPGYIIIYNLFNNIFKLNYNLLEINENICALDAFCVFLNDLQKLEEKLDTYISKNLIIDGNGGIKYEYIHEEAKPEVKDIIERITTTTVSKIPNTYSNGLDSDWFKKNVVLVFLVDTDDNDDGTQTYTFEYRKWNRYIKDWVDYGMETITINLPSTDDKWEIWKPKPSLDLLNTENRKNQRNLFKSTQTENETRKIINNDLNKLTSTINVSNISQAQNNAILVDMINQLTGVINTMNASGNNPLIKSLSVNNDGSLGLTTKFNKLDDNGNITEMTESDIKNKTQVSITPSESKPTTILDSNTLQTTIVGVTPASKTTTKITLK